MKAQTVKIYAAVSASNARIEAMKTTNTRDACEMGYPTYDETDFLKEAAILEQLSMEANNIIE